MLTRTGSFPIGFRLGRGDWQRQVPAAAAWARANGFESVDVCRADDAAAATNAGLAVGSADLLAMAEITHADPGRRRDVVAANVAYVTQAAAVGVTVLFTIVGGDPGRTRGENYRVAVDAFGPIADAAAAAGVTVAVEGFPGQSPHHALLCTTPETCRAFLTDLPRGVSLNYDPSHLIRLGVDHLRFLREFGRRVAHVHAKDTELFPEAAYELGLYQPSAFHPKHGYGDHTWRYALPGHGVARWTEIFRCLQAVGYTGRVSVELEDENFCGTEAGEKAGLAHALAFLRGA